jgi:isocitrate/isopropylmalate dehydrogenase
VSQGVSTKQAKSLRFKIAVMGGDGTGPEVVNEGLKVLKALGQSLNLNFEWIPLRPGGGTLQENRGHFAGFRLGGIAQSGRHLFGPSATRT